MVAVGQGGKFGLGRNGAIGGRKRPTFGAPRQIYPENFGQGLQSDLRQEMPWGRDPRILVVPLLKLPHSGEISRLLHLQGRLPGFASEGRALSHSLTNPTCVISLISNGDYNLIYHLITNNLLINHSIYLKLSTGVLGCG